MTNRNRVRLSKLSLGLALALAASAPAFAQNTSAAVAGRIQAADGTALTGADVTITHVQTGTVSHVTTGADGRYSARGLRVGGPYTIVVTKDGKTSTRENVYLTLSEVTNVDATVGGAAATDIGAVTVTGSAIGSDVFSPTNMGSGTLVNQQQIEALPSIKRSIEDYVRLDPRIVQIDKERGGISAGGQNNRYNNIKIDGVPTNDQFGLNDSGLPALNQPISIDWIQEFNVGISNYDVTQSDFVGANINAVTKSGTNEFKGSVYGVYRDNKMIRDNENGTRFVGFDTDWTAGVFVGGPILKDRLFFFAGYEKYERSGPGPDKGVVGSGSSNIVNITQAQLDAVRAAAITRGIANIGSPDSSATASNTDTKWFAKLDWNITDDQRLSFRYNKTDGSITRFNTSATTLQLDSNRYQDNIVFENYALNLYSDWSENFSTEANVSYSEYSSLPVLGSRLPTVSITNFPSSTATLLFGTDNSRQANQLKVDTITGYVAGDYFLGDHTIRAGFDIERNNVYNLFLQNIFGNYRVTFANFTGATPNATMPYANYQVQTSRSGKIDDAAAHFSVGTAGLFLQDTWIVTNNLTINYGFRMDRNLTSGTPAENTGFRNNFGIDNRNTIDGATTFEPRFGFNYTFDSELKRQVRGGIGLFAGSAPGVWISNSFSNPGVLTNAYNINNGTGFTGNPDAPIVPGGPGSASQLVNALSPDFKQPTVWKANLAFEQELPFHDLVFGAEMLVAMTKDGVLFNNLQLGAPAGTLPDGRQSFWQSTAVGGFTNSTSPTTRSTVNCIRVNQALPFNATTNPCLYTAAIVLQNTDKGFSRNFTTYLERPWKNNWTAKLAYTYGNTDEVSPATSSVALSNWQTRIVYNPNEDVSGTSNYEIRNRITASFSYRWNFFENAPTQVSFFYEGRNGRPFSYVFGNDANGDGNGNSGQRNDLFYIPNGNVAYSAGSSAQDIAAFNAYIDSNEYLSRHKGEVAGRNGDRAPFVNQIDVRISQKFPLFAGMDSELFLDIQNFGNLLNKDWGLIEQAAFPSNVQVANFAGVNASGQYVYDVSRFYNESTGAITAPTLQLQDVAGQSRWSAQIGFRINF
ncbi:TonB-dependent receptor [Arenimonas oryziterrae]|uniref:TonB-dependent transporter Oar-like beta-barrel domain-containing protein n=1 Tax=Arenimonas oryziterrae DSM 21050 = YC6267 TaxID=1121015 RepID=A0A091AXE9_9GAMM|nr:carboxypeptidase regulatory-like domain-containing protein [Arenimonas oryziterrae]KFN44968.1 hypothetical protein N789_02820 [Arenimonas oryziterrae DSM 21050 = YC6267]